jgi:hypothetical protein
MDDVATGIALETRSLYMEILCTLPCGGGHGNHNGRTTWQRGVSIVSLAKDFQMATDSIRAVLKELAGSYQVRTGIVAPVTLPNGEQLRGGHCAFVDPAGWEYARAACEAYQAEFEDG